MDRAELMNKPLVKLWKSPRKDFESPTGGFFTRDEYLVET
jgi:hypothetical protein